MPTSSSWSRRCRTWLSLKLWGADIDDQGAKQIAALTHLTELTLENTEIHDDTLQALQSLTRLKVLALRRSSYLTDKALEYLQGLSQPAIAPPSVQ